jgi:hypothetical protein
MGKAGWAVAGVLAAALVVGAAAGTPQDQKVLEEIRDTLREMRRVQALDVHPKLFQAHAVEEGCDLSTRCVAREKAKNDLWNERSRFFDDVRSRKLEWLTSGDGKRTAEWHGKIYLKHAMGKGCDFGNACDRDEWLSNLKGDKK